MLKAIVLSLQPIEDAVLPLSHGVFAYAAALKMIGELCPGLERQIHAPSRRKPLTVSSILGGSRAERSLNLYHNEAYRWRLTGLDESVSTCLARVSPDLGEVRLGDAVFRILDVCSSSQDDFEAGESTYEGLLEFWRTATPPLVLSFEFRSPTTFRQSEFEHPFPSPHLVFNNILETWNTYSPRRLDVEDAVELFKKTVILTNWRGETRRVELGSRRTVGFVGSFKYRVLEDFLEVRRLLSLLANYAFYSGVGWQTTHGLGQVRAYQRIR